MDGSKHRAGHTQGCQAHDLGALSPDALYARVRALYCGPVGAGLTRDEMDDAPLPTREAVWYLDGGDTPPPPRSGGAVYYYLWSLWDRAMAVDQTLDGLLAAPGRGDDAWVALAALGPRLDDMRHCWYASVPYVSRWRWDAERRAVQASQPGPCATRARPPCAKRWANALAGVLEAGDDELALEFGRDAALLQQSLRQFGLALANLATEAPPRDAWAAFCVLADVEHAGNALCAASVQFAGPAFHRTVAAWRRAGRRKPASG